jgi:hypothetical protein
MPSSAVAACPLTAAARLYRVRVAIHKREDFCRNWCPVDNVEARDNVVEGPPAAIATIHLSQCTIGPSVPCVPLIGANMSLQGWIQALALPTVIVGVLGFLIARWQIQIAREQLRHGLYDRRFAVYMAFHDLLLAVCQQEDAERELRKANAMRAHAPFLLDPQLVSLLADLHKEAFRMNQTAKLLRDQAAWSSPQDRAAAGAQLGQDKLRFVARIEELAREFERFLRLKDFASS